MPRVMPRNHLFDEHFRDFPRGYRVKPLHDADSEDGQVVRSGRHCGTGARTISQPASVSGLGVKAKYENGILTLNLPSSQPDETAGGAKRIAIT